MGGGGGLRILLLTSSHAHHRHHHPHTYMRKAIKLFKLEARARIKARNALKAKK
jgi:hypothetical protein